MGNKYRGSSTDSTSSAHQDRSRDSDETVHERANATVQDAVAEAATEGADSVSGTGELPTVSEDSALNDVEIGDELDDFKVFIVGGAVRDDLREGDRDPEDIDLMAVPRPEAEIEDPVEVLDDRDKMRTIDAEDAFPVFSDSKRREVALPRIEESTGAGFKKFDVSLVSPDTPVEEAVEIDLERRDLRYNALAYNPESGELHDPHGGREDLRDERVRHVSEAFAEDPVRVLRMSRFASRFDHEVDEDTKTLAREVAPDLDSVPGDRTRMEMEKTFKQADKPRRFFDEAADVGALEVALPEVDALQSDNTEENDAYERTMQAISSVHGRTPNSRGSMYAALGRHMGSSTPAGEEDDTGTGADADDVGERTVRRFAERTGMDSDAERTMLSSHRMGDDVASVFGDDGAEPSEIVETVERLDDDRTAMYTPETALGIASAETDFNSERAQQQVERARDAIDSVDGGTVFQGEGLSPDEIGPDGELTGDEFGELIEEYRVEEYKQRMTE